MTSTHATAYSVLWHDAPLVEFDGIPIKLGPFRYVGHWPTGKQFWHGMEINMRPAALHGLMVQAVFDA